MKNNLLGKLLCGTLMLFAAVSFTACVDDNEDVGKPYLELDSETLPFTLQGGDAAFTVKTNRPWYITKGDNSDWLTVEPMSGEGTTQVEILLPEATTGRETTLTFNIANSYGVYLSKTMKIQQGEIAAEEVLWHENFGAQGADKPLVADYNDWEKGGIYGSEVTYTAVSGKVSVRESGKLSAGYTDASNYAKLFFGTDSPAFVAGNIQTGGAVHFTLNFGGSYSKNNNGTYDNTFYADKFHVYVSGDNQTWCELTYTTAKADDYWVYATANFSLKAAAEKLYVKFAADEASVFAIDDVQLAVGSAGGQEIDLANGTTDEGGNDEPTPDTGDATATTIADLNALMTTEGTVVDKNYVLEAVVLSDVTGGNYTNNNLVLQTEGSTTAKNGLILYGSQVDPKTLGLQRGDKVKVTLYAGLAKLLDYSGLYEITGAQTDTWCKVEKTGTGTVAPTVITVAQMQDFQSMLVTIKDVTASAAGTWDVGTTTMTAGGQNLTIYVKSGAAAFAGKTYKATTGDITGIVTMYKGAVQLAPRDLNDVTAFAESSTTPDPDPTPDTPSGEVYFWKDDFSFCNSETADGTADLGTNLAGSVTGFTENYQSVAKIYKAANGKLKGGSSSVKGTLTTPAMKNVSGTANATLSVDLAAWVGSAGADATMMVIKVNNAGQINGGDSVTTAQLTADMQTFTYTLTGVTSATTITIEASAASKKRFYIDNLIIKQN